MLEISIYQIIILIYQSATAQFMNSVSGGFVSRFALALHMAMDTMQASSMQRLGSISLDDTSLSHCHLLQHPSGAVTADRAAHWKEREQGKKVSLRVQIVQKTANLISN